VVIDDELVRGAHGAAGEIGYLPLVGDPFNPSSPSCDGGLEDEIGAAGIGRGVQRASHCRRSGAVGGSRDVLSSRQRERNGSDGRRFSSRPGSAPRSPRSARSSIPSWWCSVGGIGSSPLLLSPVRGSAASLVPITARIETSRLGDRAALQAPLPSPCTRRARRCCPAEVLREHGPCQAPRLRAAVDSQQRFCLLGKAGANLRVSLRCVYQRYSHFV